MKLICKYCLVTEKFYCSKFKIFGTIDTTLTWRHHIGKLTSRLNKACYAIRSIQSFMCLGCTEKYIFFCMFMQLYLMELYFGGIHLIVKKYLKFRKE